MRVWAPRTCRWVSFVSAFTSAGLRVERFEEDGEADYPYLVALVARR